ncbi:hypothetical protein TWF281_010383 [Arthrobotrys megalospora]
MSESTAQPVATGDLGPLERLPTDVAYLIVSRLDKRDRRNLAFCSRACYKFVLLLKFRGIILTSDAIRAFRDGGVHEKLRESVRSVRFRNPFDWDPSPIWNENSAGLTYRDPIIPALRAYTLSLGYFPDITELRILYRIPAATEYTAFAALYGSISKQPFYQKLKKLELVIKVIEEKPTSGSIFTSVLQSQFSTLEKEDQEFLGDEINKNDIGGVISKLVVPAPSLTVAKISVPNIAAPWELGSDEGRHRSQFYYYPLYQAPKLKELIVELEELSSSSSRSSGGFGFSWGKSEEIPKPDFKSVEKLTVTGEDVSERFIKSALDEMFPNLTSPYFAAGHRKGYFG